MIAVILYSREDCHLCEVARQDLEALQSQFPHHLQVVDVDSSPELQRVYGFEVPVVEIGPHTLRAPLTRQDLQSALADVTERKRQFEQALEAPTPVEFQPSRVTWSRADGIADWLARHYLALFNLFIFIYVGLPFLAPALMAAGAPAPARLIYRSYSLVCHQLAYRSFFLFGEQTVYPRQAAGVGGVFNFEQATGLSEAASGDALLAARSYIGSPAIGYKVALCERDVFIYGGILGFGLLYAATGRRLKVLPWYLWVLVGLGPIGLDGVSQLLSQPPFNFLPFRESSPLLRSLTGALFGLTTAWFGYPIVEESMRETRLIMARKRQRLQNLRDT